MSRRSSRLKREAARVVAVGNEAKMLGKTPGSIKAVHPLKDGVIAEFDFAAKMLRDMFSLATCPATLFQPPEGHDLHPLWGYGG